MIGERHLGKSMHRAMAVLAATVVVVLITASPAAAAGPSVTINQAAGQSDPTSGAEIQFTATFSAPVTGFTAFDVALTGTTAPGGLTVTVTTVSSSVYTVSVSGMTGSGQVVASIPANAAEDAGNNLSLASTSTDNKVTWIEPHIPNPTVTINQAAGQSDPTSGAQIQFTATFSAPVFGFTATDVALTGTTAPGGLTVTVTTVSSSVYTVSVSGMTGPGVVIASIPGNAAMDGEGHLSAASTSTDNMVTWSLDHTPPGVTIDAAEGQADPATTAPVLFTARFSEPVTDFTAADVILAGSSAGGELVATVEGGPTVYTAAITGMTSAGAVVATIRSGAALDLAGNPSLASTSTHNSVSWAPPVLGTSSGGGANASGNGASPPIVGPATASPTPTLSLLSPCRAKHPCKTDRRGDALPLRVACGPVAPCVGAAQIVLHRKTLGVVRFHLAAGSKANLRVPLRGRAKRLLKAGPEITATLDLRLDGGLRSYLIRMVGRSTNA